MACGVLVAPILPGLSDSAGQIEAVVDAALAAGAVSVTGVPLHLRGAMKEHYLGWLADAHPDLVPEHERRFANGAYQPRAERDRIARLIAAKCPPRARPAVTADVPGAATAAPPGGVPVQLRLVS